jgi:hypothetical protein
VRVMCNTSALLFNYDVSNSDQRASSYTIIIEEYVEGSGRGLI